MNTLLSLFLNFMQFGLFGVGGGYAAIPLIRTIAVQQNGWLTEAVFTDLVAIAEMTPGPIGINAATFVGLRVGGLAGAACATLGCIAPSLVLVTLLSWLYAHSRGSQAVQTVLRTLRAVIVALIASAAIALVRSAAWSGGRVDWAAALIFLAALALLRWKKLNPILVIAGCGLARALMHAAGVV